MCRLCYQFCRHFFVLFVKASFDFSLCSPLKITTTVGRLIQKVVMVVLTIVSSGTHFLRTISSPSTLFSLWSLWCRNFHVERPSHKRHCLLSVFFCVLRYSVVRLFLIKKKQAFDFWRDVWIYLSFQNVVLWSRKQFVD